MWDAISGYLEKQRYWAQVQPVLLVLFMYAGAAIVVYEYIQWQYGFSPSPPVYVRSYVFRQVTVATAVVVAVIATFTLRRPVDVDEPPGVGRGWGAILAGSSRDCSCSRPSWPSGSRPDPGDRWQGRHIRLKVHPVGGSLLRLKDFDAFRLAYLVFELDRVQRAWDFEVDLEPFDEDLARSMTPCIPARHRLLCAARTYGARQVPRTALILITEDQFGVPPEARAFHWLHEPSTSVITTADWHFDAPSIYDYLMYSILVQGILIHLDTSCPDFLPPEVDKTTRGEILEPISQPRLMQASVMASHLGPDMEELLFGCFGPEYAADAARLLTLDWLHDERIAENAAAIDRVPLPSSPVPVPSAAP